MNVRSYVSRRRPNATCFSQEGMHRYDYEYWHVNAECVPDRSLLFSFHLFFIDICSARVVKCNLPSFLFYKSYVNLRGRQPVMGLTFMEILFRRQNEPAHMPAKDCATEYSPDIQNHRNFWTSSHSLSARILIFELRSERLWTFENVNDV